MNRRVGERKWEGKRDEWIGRRMKNEGRGEEMNGREEGGKCRGDERR